MSQNPLRILVVGPDADMVAAASGLKHLIIAGDVVDIYPSNNYDFVIGSNACRTYPNTTSFLKALLEKVRKDKVSVNKDKSEVEDKPKKKKKAKSIDTPVYSDGEDSIKFVVDDMLVGDK